MKAVIKFIIFSICSAVLASCQIETADQKEIKRLSRELRSQEAYYVSRINQLSTELNLANEQLKTREREFQNLTSTSTDARSKLEAELENLRTQIETTDHVLGLLSEGKLANAALFAQKLGIKPISNNEKLTIELLSAIQTHQEIEDTLLVTDSFHRSAWAQAVRGVLQKGAITVMGVAISLVALGCGIHIVKAIRATSNTEMKIALIATSATFIFGYFTAFANYGTDFPKFLFAASSNIGLQNTNSILTSLPYFLSILVSIALGWSVARLFRSTFLSGSLKQGIPEVALASIIFIYSIESSLTFISAPGNDVPATNFGFVFAVMMTTIYQIAKNPSKSP